MVASREPLFRNRVTQPCRRFQLRSSWPVGRYIKTAITGQTSKRYLFKIQRYCAATGRDIFHDGQRVSGLIHQGQVLSFVGRLIAPSQSQNIDGQRNASEQKPLNGISHMVVGNIIGRRRLNFLQSGNGFTGRPGARYAGYPVRSSPFTIPPSPFWIHPATLTNPLHTCAPGPSPPDVLQCAICAQPD